MKILIYSEGVYGKPDEGIRKFCLGLAEGMKKLGEEVLLLSGPETRGKRGFWSRWGVTLHPIMPSVGGRIRRYHPDLFLYIPTASYTFPSLIRGMVLSKWFKGAHFGWIGLQRTNMSFWLPKISNSFQPILFLSSENLIPKGWRGNGIQKIAVGVDLERFSPVTQNEKKYLRRRYGLNPHSFILLHVGHLIHSRNLSLLENVQKSGKDQVLLVGSTSTERDEKIQERLEAKGIQVIPQYLRNIEEIYKLSDCYLFPVTSHHASIEIPLSVLEAMATNLPVVTTRFGRLPDLFQEREGFFYAEDEKEFLDKIEESKRFVNIKTREMVLPYSWENIAKSIFDSIR